MSRGHIRRRGKKSWEIKFDGDRDSASGKRRIYYRSFKGTRKEAESEAMRLMASISTGQFLDVSRETVSHFAQRWLRDWANINVSLKTAERYGELIRRYVIPHIGALPVQKLKPSHLVELYATLQRSGGHNGA